MLQLVKRIYQRIFINSIDYDIQPLSFYAFVSTHIGCNSWIYGALSTLYPEKESAQTGLNALKRKM